MGGSAVIMEQDLDAVRDAYLKNVLQHMNKISLEHRSALAAAMMTAALSHEAMILSPVAVADRLRDLADLIERGKGPARGMVQ